MTSVVISGDTSGAITLQAPSVSGNTTLNLPASSGTVLTTTNPKSGNVIQVVQGTTSTPVTANSATWVDTTLSATITPSSTSSKILVIVQQTGCGKENDVTLQLQLVRNSTALFEFESVGAWTGSTSRNYIGTCGTSYLDSPATTSAVTYKTQMSAFSPAATVFTQYNVGSGSSTSTITLLEIAG